jgi:hypothetical protein
MFAGMNLGKTLLIFISAILLFSCKRKDDKITSIGKNEHLKLIEEFGHNDIKIANLEIVTNNSENIIASIGDIKFKVPTYTGISNESSTSINLEVGSTTKLYLEIYSDWVEAISHSFPGIKIENLDSLINLISLRKPSDSEISTMSDIAIEEIANRIMTKNLLIAGYDRTYFINSKLCVLESRETGNVYGFVLVDESVLKISGRCTHHDLLQYILNNFVE